MASAVREAGMKYHLAFALGSNLNRPPAERESSDAFAPEVGETKG
ncbi:hypothetical protein AB4225_31055 [Streptomyces sp. 2RAF24]